MALQVLQVSQVLQAALQDRSLMVLQVLSGSGWVKWTARFAAGADKTAVRAVLVINAGNVSATTTTRWSALGLTGSGYVARDV